MFLKCVSPATTWNSSRALVLFLTVCVFLLYCAYTQRHHQQPGAGGSLTSLSQLWQLDNRTKYYYILSTSENNASDSSRVNVHDPNYDVVNDDAAGSRRIDRRKTVKRMNVEQIVPLSRPKNCASNDSTTAAEALTAQNVGGKYRLVTDTRARPGSRQLPSALIIGVKKSGTRALLEFMRIHPDVRAAGCEVHYFDRHYQRGLSWYRRQMPVTIAGQLTMEKTPSYFITREAPKRVYAMNPKTKLLLVVRDPVTRAISDYTQAVSKKVTVKRFEELAFVNGSLGE